MQIKPFIRLRSIISKGCANPGFFKYIYTMSQQLFTVAPDLLASPGRHASHLGTSFTHDLDSLTRVLTPLWQCNEGGINHINTAAIIRNSNNSTKDAGSSRFPRLRLKPAPAFSRAQHHPRACDVRERPARPPGHHT